MEEKKVEIKAQQPKKEKLSYEELENVCHQLSEQSSALYKRLQEANMTNAFKRLDYLFAVIENKTAFPKDFVEQCVSEIVISMTIPEEKEEEEDKE